MTMPTRLSPSTLALTILPLIVAALFVFGPPGQAGAACTSATCPAGNVCLDATTCGPFAVSPSPVNTGPNSFNVAVGTNAFDPPLTFSLQHCLGTTDVCQTPALKPTYWTADGTNTGFTVLNLNVPMRRVYTEQFLGTYGPATNQGQISVTTFPGYNPIQADDDLGCTAPGCFRRVRWQLQPVYNTTPSYVKYGRVAPSWILDNGWQAQATHIGGMIITPSGNLWAMNNPNDGTIINRDLNGVWTKKTIGAAPGMYEITAYDDNRLWVYGTNGSTWHTNNGGAFWDNHVIPSPDQVYSLRYYGPDNVAAITTALSGGSAIYYIDPTDTWVLKKGFPTESCNQLATVTGRAVWIACKNGHLLTTTNFTAASPTFTTTTTSGTINFTTIDTVDEQSIYAFGNDGVTNYMYHSADGGTSWQNTAIPAGLSTIMVQNITMVGSDRFWGYGGNYGFFYDKNTTPQLTVYNFGVQVDRLTAGPDDTISAILTGQQFVSLRVNPATIDNTLTDLSTNTTGYHTFILNNLLSSTPYYYTFNNINKITAGTWFASGNFGTFTTPAADFIPPTISITTPAGPYPKYLNTCPLVVSGTAVDTAPGTLVDVKVDIDGGAPITAAGTTSWSASIPCGSLTPGAHTINAKAFDGFNTTTASITIFFDNTAPTITWSPPSTVTVPTLTLSGTATDALDQVAVVQYRLNGSAPVGLTITTGATVTWTTPSLTLNPGSNLIQILATDRAGNVGAVITFVTYTDNVPPTLTIVNPAALPFVTKVPNYQTTGTASDNVGLASVTITSAQTGAQTVNGSAAWNSFLNLVPGTNTITWQATDTATPPNVTTVTGVIILDQTAPVITFNPTPPATVTSPTLTISGTATDALDQVATVEYQLNGGPRLSLGITAAASVAWATPVLTLNPGSNTIQIFATDRVGNSTGVGVTVIYNVPTFTLSVAPTADATVTKGTVLTYALTITPVNGYNSLINLSSVGSGPGITGLGPSVSPSSYTAPYAAPITLTVNTASANVGGPYTVTVTVTSFDLAITQTISVRITVLPAPDFSLAPVPPPVTVVAGNAANYTMTVAGNSTYVYPNPPGMIWTTSPLPAGVTVGAGSFAALTGDPSSSGTGTTPLRLNTTVATVAGTYTIVVTANDGTISHSVNLTLTVGAAPDFTLTVTPASANVTAGSGVAATFNLTVASIGGFNGSVVLTYNINDPAVTSTFTPSLVVGSGTSTARVLVDSPVQCAPPGPCALTLTFRAISLFPPLTKLVPVTLNITPDTTPPVISGITAIPGVNDVSISWTTNEPTDSMISLYAGPGATNLIGTATSLLAQPCTSGCHVVIYSSLIQNTTYFYTVTSVDTAYKPVNPQGNLATSPPLQFTTLLAPDNTKPIVNIAAPVNGDTITGATTVIMTASDDHTLDHINLKIAGTTVDTNSACSALTCNFSVPWNTMAPILTNGNYTLTATSYSTRGPAFASDPFSITVTVFNDTTPPQVICLPGQTFCQPEAINLSCAGNVCSIDIHWKTDKLSTSEVRYGLTSGYGTYVPILTPLVTDHVVRLTNLAKNTFYHYQITSCNVSNYCTN